MAIAIGLVGAAACNQILGNQDGHTGDALADSGGTSSGAAASSSSSSSGEAGASSSSSSGGSDASSSGCLGGFCGEYELTQLPAYCGDDPTFVLRIAATEGFLLVDCSRGPSVAVALSVDGAAGESQHYQPDFPDAVSTKPDLGAPQATNVVFDSLLNPEGIRSCTWAPAPGCNRVPNTGMASVMVSAKGGVLLGRIFDMSAAIIRFVGTDSSGTDSSRDLVVHGASTLDNAVFTANGKTLFYRFRSAGEAPKAISRVDYPVPGTMAPDLMVPEEPRLLAANDQQLFVSPCQQSAVCAISLDGAGSAPITQVVATSGTSTVDQLFVDGSRLLFATTSTTSIGAKAFECSVNDCMAPTPIGSTLSSFTVNSRSLFVLIDGAIWTAKRGPLRPAR